jgi:hypothetical protein
MDTVTWVQASAAVIMAIATLALVTITGYYAYLTHRLVKSQVDPVVEFEFDMSSNELAIGNSGPYLVLDVSVNADSTTFVGPPYNKPGITLRSGHRIPGRKPTDWWAVDKIGPGEIQRKPIGDVIENALRGTDMMEQAGKRGELREVSPKENVQFFTFVQFRLTFHRDFDRKRYAMQKLLWVGRDASGNPHVWDAELLRTPLMEEMLGRVRGFMR